MGPAEPCFVRAHASYWASKSGTAVLQSVPAKRVHTQDIVGLRSFLEGKGEKSLFSEEIFSSLHGASGYNRHSMGAAEPNSPTKDRTWLLNISV